MSTALLELHGVSAHYRPPGALWRAGAARQALHAVSLRVHPGQTLALVGESGSGKSTLAKVVVGLHPASAGQILLDGHALDTRARAWPLALRRRVQMVFQDTLGCLHPRWRIGAILEEPLRIHRVGDAAQRRARVARLIADVGLSPEHLTRLPHQLSGGQRQRVGIARALALQPDLLVLDEPVSALDALIQTQILDLLAELRERYRLACLFISHDLGVVRQIADTIAVMSDGRIVEQGDRDTVLGHARHPYTRSLLDAIPGRDARQTASI